ncbi:NEW3 domain-containing protein [bacterium]|nr:NEW3 domain-containing protein [bacterium]
MNSKLINVFLAAVLMLAWCFQCAPAQQDQASLLLDLKKARASYQSASQKLESDRKLYENKAISEDEFIRSRNEALSAEVDYQKLILRVISQQSYIIVERAVKYQTPRGERRVKVTLRSTMEGNQEYLDQFQEHFDVFTPEMRSSRIYNIFVSLLEPGSNTIIGAPYETRIPTLDMGGATVADFGLLKDVETVCVSLNYGGRKDEKNIFLEKDASASVVDINSMQFSQEVDLGGAASYDLTLERFSTSDDVYKLAVVNLPRQVSCDFLDSETGARLSQVKFGQGVNTKKLSLKAYLPERDDEQVVIDRPLEFFALVLTLEQAEKLGDPTGRQFTPEQLAEFQAGSVRLELIPRGVGRIEVRAPSLYHEITVGDSLALEVTVRNIGTRRLDNVKISTDNPLNWRSRIEPDLIRSLEPEKEAQVSLVFLPPEDVGVGAQEVKIRTEALADNRAVRTEDKTVRIQVKARTEVLWTTVLVLALVGLVVGIVVFGVKISRR